MNENIDNRGNQNLSPSGETEGGLDLSKVGRYEMWAESFHCDFQHRLQMGHLGNYMLNAADFHSTERTFGMRYLNTINKTWVLSRLCIEMDEMPLQYSHFFIETWVESAMRYFTQRNFRVEDKETGRSLGFGRSIWALIDLDSRQPTDILSVHDGHISDWIEKDKECPIDKPGRVKMDKDAELVTTIETHYSDVDINGHINSVKYIEHILDLFSLDYYKEYRLKRFDIAYVAESHFGDKLNFYKEEAPSNSPRGESLVSTEDSRGYMIRITKTPADGGEEVEVVRCKVNFVKE